MLIKLCAESDMTKTRVYDRYKRLQDGRKDMKT